MKSTLTIVFVFLFLGSIFATLGQTTVNSNGLFQLNSPAPLCDAASPVALAGVHLSNSLQLSDTLGGCQVELVQSNTGIHRVRLAKAHTMAQMPTMTRGATEIVGVVPSAVKPGDAVLYIKTVQPVQQPDGSTIQNVVSSVGIPIKVGEVATRGAAIEFAVCDEACAAPKGLDLLIETKTGSLAAVLVGDVVKISLE